MYRVRTEHVDDDPGFRVAYDWLRDQAAARLPGATGRYPIWAYARIPRPALREIANAHDPDDVGELLLTLRLPAERVLLSDYEMWHCVLNAGPCDPPAPPVSYEDWTENWMQEYDKITPVQVIRSWQHVLDVDGWIRYYPRAIVQATFEELRLEDVIRVVPLARPGVSRARRIGGLVRYL